MISGRTRGCPQVPGVLLREQTHPGAHAKRVVTCFGLVQLGQKHCSLQRAAQHLLAVKV